MGSESVAQSMRMNIRRKSLSDRNLLDNSSYAASREPAAASVDQQRGSILLKLTQRLLAGGNISGERHPDCIPKGNIALFLSLTADENRFCAQPNIVEI